MASVPSLTERPPKKFEPRTVAFPEDTQEKITKELCKEIEALIKRNEPLHTRKVPEWRRIVDAKPREENKSWPFANCSNIVYPAVGEARDDLAARVLMLVWGTAPVAHFSYFTKEKTPEARKNKQKSTTLEQFVDYVAYDAEELNLYTRENKWFTESAGLGKSWVCVAPEERIEKVYAGYYPGKNDKEPAIVEFDGDDGETTLYEGPKVVNLRYEDILIDDHEIPFEENDPIIRRCVLKRKKLRERGNKGHFLAKAVEAIEGKPDRYGESPIRQRESQRKGLQPNDSMAEWDIYECYFSWWHNNQKFRLIAWIHFTTKTCLNCVYSFIPRNNVPIIETRLSIDGRGFAEMLNSFQEEISTAKNSRADAITYGILGVNSIDLQQSKTIDRNFVITPGMFIPARAGSFQHYEMANAAIGSLSLQNEELLVQQCKSRAAIDPAIRAMGAGATNKKGAYSSMGTLSIMQDGNSRNDHRTSDFRHSHIKLISQCVDFYGMMGLGRKAKLAGLSQDLLTAALKDHADRVLRSSIRAANASMNKEITKQNLIILNQSISQYIKETSSQIQAIMNQGTPPQYKKWMYNMIIAKTLLTQETIRQFQISEQPEEFVPDIEEFLKEFVPDDEAQAKQPAGIGPVPVGPVAEAIRRRAQGGNAPIVPGIPNAPGGPPGTMQ